MLSAFQYSTAEIQLIILDERRRYNVYWALMLFKYSSYFLNRIHMLGIAGSGFSGVVELVVGGLLLSMSTWYWRRASCGQPTGLVVSRFRLHRLIFLFGLW